MRSIGKNHRRGVTLLESLVLVVILAIVAAGAGQSLQAITKIPSQTDATLVDENALVSKLEQMRSVSFDNLPIGTAITPYSDGTVSVDVAYADPAGGATPNVNWKQVTARLTNGRQLVMTVCKP
jgi:type II secretory pathway pseudopilin PulG